MTVSRVVRKNGRSYLEHNGKPALLYGIQLRIDDATFAGCPEEQIETYFRMAAAYHFPMVAVPVLWGRDVEPCIVSGTECEFLKRMLSYIYKYDLTVQWLWFGSNVCGAQEIPEDIRNDAEHFPKFPAPDGQMMTDFTNPQFIEREKRAIRFFLDSLKRFDPERRTSGIQVENEITMGDYWGRRGEYLVLMDEIGKTVKSSEFSLFTRANAQAPEIYLGEDPILKQLNSLDGIDAVGVDIYHRSVSYFSQFSDYLTGLDGNLGHMAEHGAHVASLARSICDTLQRGAGTILYELRTVSIRDDYDFGLFRKSNSEWIERDGTAPVQYQWTVGEMTEETNTAEIGVLNEMIKPLTVPLAVAPVGNIAMLESGERRKLGEYTVAFSAEDDPDGFAMAVAYDGYLYGFSLAHHGKFTFDEMICAEVWIYEYNGWKPYGEIENSLDTERGFAYRIRRKSC